MIQPVARTKKSLSEKAVIRARVRGNSLEVLDRIPLREGEEVLISIYEAKPSASDSDALRRAAGAWKGIVDADKLLADIYSDRLISTRPAPSV